jgi:hypothetical protein
MFTCQTPEIESGRAAAETTVRPFDATTGRFSGSPGLSDQLIARWQVPALLRRGGDED